MEAGAAGGGFTTLPQRGPAVPALPTCPLSRHACLQASLVDSRLWATRLTWGPGASRTCPHHFPRESRGPGGGPCRVCRSEHVPVGRGGSHRSRAG